MGLDYQAIGTRVRRLRKARGLTQQTLAELSDQEPSNISHIERGATKLSLPTLVNIANALEVTVDELLEELRGKGYTDLSAVKYAILETNGQLSVLPYANQKPPTARDVKVSVEEGGLPRVVVSDGKLLERNLKALGHDRPWLDKQLSQRGCRDMAEVFLLLVDEGDAVYFARKDA